MKKKNYLMSDSHLHLVDKEISWLSFNERVLQEAANPDVPLIQRLHYLGIFSNNLDEFFRVRVADVSRLAEYAPNGDTQKRYSALLAEIQKGSKRLQKRFDSVFLALMRDLNRQKVYLINEQQLDSQQAAWVSRYFQQTLLPLLNPILLEPGKPFPRILDGHIYLAIRIRANGSIRYGLVDIPTESLSRFVQIPHRKGGKGKVFIVLDNIIRHCLADVFRGVIDIEHAEAYTFKITLDAELEVDNAVYQGMIKKMMLSLKKRQKGDPERFVYDSDMPADLLDFLVKGLRLTQFDSIMGGSRYHNAKDFMGFPGVGKPFLEQKVWPVLPVPALQGKDTQLFSVIRQQDLMLCYPYHSFDTVIDLLKTAAIDPAVQSIHISLYRVARNSRIVDALLNARSNYKDVTVVVELQARFDEAANINWAGTLSDAGINVIFGVPGLKVHAKLILISRMEDKQLRYYSHIGTGNFNEKTSRVYTDVSLLTYNQEIGRDVARVFDFLAFNYKRHDFDHLLVSPHSTRNQIEKMIRHEIRQALQGNPAAITFKCNNLVDSEIIRLLYECNDAGVRVRIICRGMCALVPGIKNRSEHIEVISIVDSFLEHARIYVFYNNGNPRYFISSADLMTRNLDFRVEVTAPVYDPALQLCLQDMLDIQWADNVKARIIDAAQSNRLRTGKGNARIRSQWVTRNYLKTGKLPATIIRLQKSWRKDLEKKR